MNIDTALFPPRPTYHAAGAPIFLEPVVGSGEQLCIAVAAFGHDGKFGISPVFNDDRAKCMLGLNAGRFSSIVSMAVSSLNQHLSAGNKLEQWMPPIKGVRLGDVSSAYVNDLAMMMRTIARNHAFLSNMADFSAEDDSMDPDRAASERWLTQVRQAAAKKMPSIEVNFARSAQLVLKGSKTKFDYLGRNFIAQIDRLIPDNNISKYVIRAKAKLWDLEAMREHQGDLGIPKENYELLIYSPKDNDPAYSDRQIVRLHECLAELTEVGDKQRLIVRSVASAEDAADRIIRAEAA